MILFFYQVRIPGISRLMNRDSIPDNMLLLTGAAGSGKSIYCRQFFLEGINHGDYCIYVSSTLTDKQYRSQFNSISELDLNNNSKFINPYYYKDVDPSKKLSITVDEIRGIITEIKNSGNKKRPGRSSIKPEISKNKDNGPQGSSMLLIVDSLTHLLAIFGEKAVETFVTDIYYLLKMFEVEAIFTLTTSSSNEYETNRLSSIFDGILEIKLEERNQMFTRNIRLLSIKGLHHNPTWIRFDITSEGSLTFGEHLHSLVCYLCKDPIFDVPVMYSDLPFHSSHLDIYMKLAGAYGFHIAEVGLASEVINANFFFIDIVGLSDPSYSVTKQREKIENLNNLIISCDAFNQDDKKIILPTGDGMVIGFLLNPELPFQLSIQLHQKLRDYNAEKNNGDVIGVRIGLNSGSVFTVNDVKNNQNYWGPGIILARRIMDMGNNLHILIADILAEALIALKDEYKTSIKSIGTYQVKHGQSIKLYSAFSKDFGNPEIPARKDF